MENQTTPPSPLYCCYRIQAQKRFDRGEILSRSLEKCLRECKGYNSDCRTYTPFVSAKN